MRMPIGAGFANDLETATIIGRACVSSSAARGEGRVFLGRRVRRARRRALARRGDEGLGLLQDWRRRQGLVHRRQGLVQPRRHRGFGAWGRVVQVTCDAWKGVLGVVPRRGQGCCETVFTRTCYRTCCSTFCCCRTCCLRDVLEQITQETSETTGHSLFSFVARGARACFMPTLGCPARNLAPTIRT
jgi:hypothetical protein